MTRAELYRLKADCPPDMRRAMWTLQKIVERNRSSFATQDYAKRRKAALKATRSPRIGDRT